MKCEDKIRYPSRKLALTAANMKSAAEGIYLRVYHCPTCGKWHMTSQPQVLAEHPQRRTA